MKFIEFVACVYCKEEADHIEYWLDAVAHKKCKTSNRKDRSRPIWNWALRRWGQKWPDMEYKIRTRRDKHYRQYGQL